MLPFKISQMFQSISHVSVRKWSVHCLDPFGRYWIPGVYSIVFFLKLNLNRLLIMWWGHEIRWLIRAVIIVVMMHWFLKIPKLFQLLSMFCGVARFRRLLWHHLTYLFLLFKLVFCNFSIIPGRFINLLQFLPLNKFSDAAVLNLIQYDCTLRPVVWFNR